MTTPTPPPNDHNAAAPRTRWALRWGLILLLLLILIGINVLYVPAASWRSPLTGAPGELLYAAGFDGFQDEWQQYVGRQEAQIENGVLRISTENSAVIYSAARPFFRDLDISVSAQAVEGDVNNAFGIVYRLQEPSTDCRMPLQIMCDLADSGGLLGTGLNLVFRQPEQATGYSMFLISSDGYYSVWRGTPDGENSVISTWIPSEAIRQGLNAENRMRVVGRGDEYRFFINGEQVSLCIPDSPDGISTFYEVTGECIDGTMQPTLTDDTFREGQIALAIDAANSLPGFTIEFDDLIIISPQDDTQDSDSL